ncbi:hypothetical protein LTR53_018022, partial [Teratosphaeriaceae sp. CCFEE 6253]
MRDPSPPSSQTLQHDSQATEATTSPPPSALDLSYLPPIFLSSTHFGSDDLHELEDGLAAAGATLTFDVREARIVLSKVQHKKRAAFDLRAKGLWTKEVVPVDLETSTRAADDTGPAYVRPRKKQRINSPNGAALIAGSSQAAAIVVDDEDPDSKVDVAMSPERKQGLAVPSLHSSGLDAVRSPRTTGPANVEPDIIRVVKIRWFEDSAKAGHPLPLKQYLTYEAREIPKPVEQTTTQPSTPLKHPIKAVSSETSSVKAATPRSRQDKLRIPGRAAEDAAHATKSHDRFGRRDFHHTSTASKTASWAAGHGKKQDFGHLLHATTTEEESGQASDSPEMPDW